MTGFRESPLPGATAVAPASGPPSAEDILRALASHTPYGVFRSNAEGGCEFVNGRWCELAGLTPEQAVGDGWARALHPDDRERVAAEWAQASRQGRDSIVEYRFLRPDGTVCWIEGFATPLRDAEGAVVGWIGTCLDLTARKATEAALLRASEHDALTGLGNRRKLMADLERALAGATGPAPHLLVLFDLNGFKGYNDSFGHPAGDALLARLGGKLAAVPGEHGAAYRLGGDEFCLVVETPTDELGAVLDRASNALSEHGEGFHVSSSFGAALIPDEATEASEALRLADERLYAQKYSRRGETDRTMHAFLEALAEREPELQEHLEGVGVLAVEVGERLGLRRDELDDLSRAAQLHDLGKLAVPDEILRKAGPLNASEWAFIHQHTVVGERILRASLAFRSIAGVVRSSHESWDGSGYPDGLAGEEIPLASRIVCACDAYAAMTADRPYRKALSAETALKEIERAAGTQFDPTVVRVLAALVRDKREAERAA